MDAASQQPSTAEFDERVSNTWPQVSTVEIVLEAATGIVIGGLRVQSLIFGEQDEHERVCLITLKTSMDKAT